MKCESSDVRKFLEKSKFQNFSELFKVKTRNYNRSRFQFVCKIPLLARALGLKAAAARPSARATIGYLVYKIPI